MNKTVISSFLRLIRWKNILIIMLSMLIVWLFVNNNFVPESLQSLSGKNLIFIIASTSLIAAAGYVINDYFDVKIDAINHPKHLIISNLISRRTALFLHNLFNAVGVLLVFLVSKDMGNYLYLMVPIFSITILWFYSTHFKRMPIVGNIIVAFLTMFSILQLFIYEPYLYTFIHQSPILESGRNNPFYLILGISLLVFLLNLMRELVKDMEDLKGDSEQGCRTYPILYGLKSSARLVIGLSIFTLFTLLLVTIYFVVISKWLFAIYILFFSILPLSIFTFLFPKKLTKFHFTKMSSFLKIIMIAGLLLLFLLTI